MQMDLKIEIIAKQAGDNIKKLLKNKNISVDGNKITIGTIKPLILTINSNN